MTVVHSKLSVTLINSVDISQYTKQCQWNAKRSEHNNTGMGQEDDSYNPGTKEGTVTLSGDYNDAVAGPAATIRPLYDAGTIVPIEYRPAGTGAGKAKRSASCFVTAYNESTAVGGNVQWTAELRLTGPTVTTPQV